MPGSNAVVTHNETGNPVYFDYYPPDIRLPRMIITYCENLTAMSGITMFIIDREVNSVEMAREFDSRGWGLLSMLDSNQYKDLSDWETKLEGRLEDGSDRITSYNVCYTKLLRWQRYRAKCSAAL